MNIEKRNVSEAKKKMVAGKQFYKCANRPNSNINRLKHYLCPLWQKNDENKGSFDESGYEIDHIIEHSLTFNDDIENLQALCKMCHTVKTKRFMINEHGGTKKSNIDHIKILYCQFFVNLIQTSNTDFEITSKELFINFETDLKENAPDQIKYTSNIKLSIYLKALKIDGVEGPIHTKYGNRYKFNCLLAKEWLYKKGYIEKEIKFLDLKIDVSNT
jgi:hypothetical protein